jgi:hypothetical protein
MFIGSLFQQASVIARKISFNHAPPSKLAHYTYLSTFYAFLFDLGIPSLGAHFDFHAYVSYGIIILGFSIKFLLVANRIRKSSKEQSKRKAFKKEHVLTTSFID